MSDTAVVRPAKPRHGGDLSFATEEYGTPDNGWLDLSTGINPHPYPVDANAVSKDLVGLPDPTALDSLTDAARSAWSVPPGLAIAAVPGTEIAIRLLPLLVPDGPAAIFGPTYTSHAEAWHNLGRTVAEAEWPDPPRPDARVAVICNPNNPDGRLIPVSDLRNFVAAQTGVGVTTIVDEAFVDLHPEASLIPQTGNLDTVVLRSFGKFYGLAGLRLGFVIGPPDRLSPLRRLLGDWPVSSPAIQIGRRSLADRAWQDDTRSRLAEAATRLRTLLDRRGFDIAGGTDLYVLIRHDQADAIHRELARQGIWTRMFDYRPDWLRIGLPADAGDFARLDEALGVIKSPTGE